MATGNSRFLKLKIPSFSTKNPKNSRYQNIVKLQSVYICLYLGLVLIFYVFLRTHVYCLFIVDNVK